jgi:hypothetical protein
MLAATWVVSTNKERPGVRILFAEQNVGYEPQGLMSMSAVLKQAGHEVALAVAEFEDPVRIACQFRPDVMGFSVLTGHSAARWTGTGASAAPLRRSGRRQGSERRSPFSADRIPLSFLTLSTKKAWTASALERAKARS